VEFFLVVPLILLVLIAAVQVIGLARTRIELQAAARDGVRVAATTPDPSKAVDAVMAALPPGLRDRARVSVERPSRAGVPARVIVTVKYLIGKPFPADFGVEVTAQATMRTEK